MRKKLTKSNKNVVSIGISARMGEYVGIDPTVIRVLYVFLSLVVLGSPIILYVLLVLTIPSARPARANYGHDDACYEKSNYREQAREQTKKRREAGEIDDDEWSSF